MFIVSSNASALYGPPWSEIICVDIHRNISIRSSNLIKLVSMINQMRGIAVFETTV